MNKSWLIRDGSVVTAKGYGLDGRGPIPGSGKKCSLLHSVQTDFEAHPTSYTRGSGCLSSKVKQPRRETDYRCPCSAEVKNDGAIPPFPHTSSWPPQTLPSFTVKYAVIPCRISSLHCLYRHQNASKRDQAENVTKTRDSSVREADYRDRMFSCLRRALMNMQTRTAETGACG
jgi:hypothetical protein